MNKLTISIFQNQIFLKIISELKLFSEFEIKYYDDLSLCTKEAENYKHLAIFFDTQEIKNNYTKIKKSNFPKIIITKSEDQKGMIQGNFLENLNMPFSALELKKKIILLISKYQFKSNSLINLGSYIIDKNERKIKKNNLELQLTEKEVKFLILFSQHNKPLHRNLILKSVWNYSSKTDTHTVETHIHRLRKKILEKFNDNKFIKNNEEGYYI